MANGKGYPECMTCKHAGVRDSKSVCTLHHFRIPTEAGPYLICRDWVHRSEPISIEYGKERFFTDPKTLYQYDIYSSGPPMREFRFADLDPVTGTGED